MSPANTPYAREWARLEKAGLTPFEIGDALVKKWPDTRRIGFIIFDRGGRTAFVKFAKYLIKQGIAIDYEYRSKAEMKEEGDVDDARGYIDVIGETTPIPYNKLAQFADETAGNYEVYDDEYTGEYDSEGYQTRFENPPPRKLKAKLLR